MFQIYNEQVYDLLNFDQKNAGSGRQNLTKDNQLKMRMNKNE